MTTQPFAQLNYSVRTDEMRPCYWAAACPQLTQILEAAARSWECLGLSSTSIWARKRTKALKHTKKKLYYTKCTVVKEHRGQPQFLDGLLFVLNELLLVYGLKWKHAKTNIVQIYHFPNSIICKSSVPSIKNYRDRRFSQGNIKIYFILDLFQIWFKLQLSKQYNAKGNCNRKCA